MQSEAALWWWSVEGLQKRKRGCSFHLTPSSDLLCCKNQIIKRPQSTKDSPTLGVKLISIRRRPPCRLPLRVTFLILLRSESTLLSSALLFHEAAARTSEEIQAWMQQNGMNFLCSDCIVGFLRRFCHIFYWCLWPWASPSSPTPRAGPPRVRGDDNTPASNPMNLPATLGGNRVTRSRFVPPPLLTRAVIYRVLRRWRWWNPSLWSERAALFHVIQMTDSYNRPGGVETWRVDRNWSSSDDAAAMKKLFHRKPFVTQVCFIPSEEFHHFIISFFLSWMLQKFLII